MLLQQQRVLDCIRVSDEVHSRSAAETQLIAHVRTGNAAGFVNIASGIACLRINFVAEWSSFISIGNERSSGSSNESSYESCS